MTFAATGTAFPVLKVMIDAGGAGGADGAARSDVATFGG